MEKEKSKKKEPWLKYRHRIVRNVAYAVMYPYTRIKYGIEIERFRAQGDRAYLILMNHQTAFDQFFVGMTFRGPVYYVASEDLFSNGWISSLLRWLVAPIPIKKQTSDVAAVKNCVRVAKEGGTIAIAPEGNRTYSGRTGYMNPAIASLAKLIKLPVALLRIEGGYGVHPRWSDVVRRGKMRAYVSRVIEPEEYAGLSKSELLAIIEEGLAVDEGVADGLYKSGRDWYDYQEQFVRSLDLTKWTEEPLYRDSVRLSEVVVYERKALLRRDASVSLYGDRIVIDEGSGEELVFPFREVSAVSVLGRNKLNIYHGERLYQLKGGKRFNALKYVNIYYRSKNMGRGDKSGEFLGL